MITRESIKGDLYVKEIETAKHKQNITERVLTNETMTLFDNGKNGISDCFSVVTHPDMVPNLDEYSLKENDYEVKFVRHNSELYNTIEVDEKIFPQHITDDYFLIELNNGEEAIVRVENSFRHITSQSIDDMDELENQYQDYEPVSVGGPDNYEPEHIFVVSKVAPTKVRAKQLFTEEYLSKLVEEGRVKQLVSIS